VFFEKHPCFWGKNEEKCIFGLKRATEKRKYEPKMRQKTPKRAPISMFLMQKERENKALFSQTNCLQADNFYIRWFAMYTTYCAIVPLACFQNNFALRACVFA
jgi:hypothetical protein